MFQEVVGVSQQATTLLPVAGAEKRSDRPDCEGSYEGTLRAERGKYEPGTGGGGQGHSAQLDGQ